MGATVERACRATGTPGEPGYCVPLTTAALCAGPPPPKSITPAPVMITNHPTSEPCAQRVMPASRPVRECRRALAGGREDAAPWNAARVFAANDNRAAEPPCGRHGVGMGCCLSACL